MLEREQNLTLEQSTDGRVNAVRLNPIFFSRSAFLEIVRFQMFSEDPKEILIISKKRKSLSISSAFFRSARRYNVQDESDLLNNLANRMAKAHRVVIQIPRTAEKL